jgi:hypothetical protein
MTRRPCGSWCWGPKTVYGIYPKGSQMGLETIDMGRQLDSRCQQQASF